MANNESIQGAAVEDIKSQCKSSRCSTKLVREVMGRLSEQKRKLVESIGFGSLLAFPDIKKINRNLSVWLLERVDVETKTLIIGAGKRLEMETGDVSLVFGIPCRGRQVLGKVPPTKEVKINIMRSCFGTSQWEHRSVKAAQEIIEKEFSGDMTTSEQNAFKQCFVIFIMATLLAPAAKHDYACVDYWNAISDPLHIGDYNWAEYVMERLIEGAVKLKSDLACGVKAPKLTGCTLFLQVLYLDSIDTGIWNLEHKKFPRINSFSFEHMRGMISADKGTGDAQTGDRGFGGSHLRRPSEVCYHWATAYKPSGEWAGMCVQRALWRTANQMTRVLNVSAEASGPLFAALSDFHEQMNPVFGVQFFRLVSVLLTILDTYAKGYKRMNPTQSHDVIQDTDSICRALISMNREVADADGCGSSFNQIPYAGKRKRVETHDPPCYSRQSTEASCVENVHSALLSSSKMYDDIDLRVVKAVAECSLQQREQVLADVLGQCSGGSSRSGALPAEANMSSKEGRPPGAMVGCPSSNLKANPTNIRDCLAQFGSRYTHPSTGGLLHQFLGSAEIGIDVMDGIIRNFKRREEALFTINSVSGYRHFVESAFMAILTSRSYDVEGETMQILLGSDHMGCERKKMKMIIFPTILHNRWVCYAWRLKDNTIVVWDPLLASSSADIRHFHIKITCALRKCLDTVAASLFDGWDYDWNEASIEWFDHTLSGESWLNRTGILCAYFCWHFDGVNLHGKYTMENLKDIAFDVLGTITGTTDVEQICDQIV